MHCDMSRALYSCGAKHRVDWTEYGRLKPHDILHSSYCLAGAEGKIGANCGKEMLQTFLLDSGYNFPFILRWNLPRVDP